jgi:hypothetical protein
MRRGAGRRISNWDSRGRREVLALVQRAHAAGGHRDRKREGLKVEISKLSTSDACDFAAVFDAMMDRAYCYALYPPLHPQRRLWRRRVQPFSLLLMSRARRLRARACGSRFAQRGDARRGSRKSPDRGPGATIRTRPSGHERCGSAGSVPSARRKARAKLEIRSRTRSYSLCPTAWLNFTSPKWSWMHAAMRLMRR